MLLGNEILPRQLKEEHRIAEDTTGHTVVEQEMRVVGVLVGAEQFKGDLFIETFNGDSAELTRTLLPMGDAQGSFKVLSLSDFSCLSYLPHHTQSIHRLRRSSRLGVDVNHCRSRSGRGRYA